MSAASRLAEAQQISRIYHASQSYLGVTVTAESLKLWQDVSQSPKQLGASSGKYIGQMGKLLTVRRKHALTIALAYYRLLRAVWTGSTIEDPYNTSTVSTTTLNSLRTEFYDTVDKYAPKVLETEAIPDSATSKKSDLQIKVDRLEALKKRLDDLDKELADRAVTDLKAVGPGSMAKAEKGVSEDTPTSKVDKIREDAHTVAGSKTASIGSMITQDGGRRSLDEIRSQDKKAIGFARVSRTGTPCGWCAMLISRGAVYKSSASAQFTSDGGTYHPNDNCYCEPVFTDEQYDDDSRFDLNREYDSLWGKVTRGHSGKDALAVWRKYIRSHPHKPINAQAA